MKIMAGIEVSTDYYDININNKDSDDQTMIILQFSLNRP